MIQTRLAAFLDRELDAGETAQVRRHIEACGRCSDDLDCCRSVKRLISSLPTHHPKPGFEERLLNAFWRGRLANAGGRSRRAANSMGWGAALVAGVAVISALTVFQLQQGPTQNPSESRQAELRRMLENDQAYDQARNPLSPGIRVNLDRDFEAR
ncbi:MAG: zf-HC2 domain-containing protein [Armatimonadetes bacterium]|nr:zf-HC2 domain-containing protein [Armatimonadota bacterium]